MPRRRRHGCHTSSKTGLYSRTYICVFFPLISGIERPESQLATLAGRLKATAPVCTGKLQRSVTLTWEDLTPPVPPHQQILLDQIWSVRIDAIYYAEYQRHIQSPPDWWTAAIAALRLKQLIYGTGG